MRREVLVAAVLAGASLAAAPREFSSGTARVSLVELYTSEGCSSCPPAERWLGTLRDDSGLWQNFVPIEFHVNYWDRLGWTDRFANAAFTRREYAYAAAWSSRTVYTPCFVRDGVEWKVRSDPNRGADPAAGELELKVDDAGGIHAVWRPRSGSDASAYDLHLALLGSGFTSRVTAGENRGEILRHDFVALALREDPLQPGTEDGTYELDLPLPKSPMADVSRLALAAWATRSGELTPLQATGGWLE